MVKVDQMTQEQRAKKLLEYSGILGWRRPHLALSIRMDAEDLLEGIEPHGPDGWRWRTIQVNHPLKKR